MSGSGGAVTGGENQVDGDDPAVDPPTPPRPKRDAFDYLEIILIPLITAVLSVAGGAFAFQFATRDNQDTIAFEREEAAKQFSKEQKQEKYDAILEQATQLENAGSFSSSAVNSLFIPSIAEAFSQAAGEATQNLEEGSPEHLGTDVNPNYNIGTGNYYSSPQSGLGSVRDTWQSAYTDFDQAISNAVIAGSDAVIQYALALRDKYRNDYYDTVLASIDAQLPSWPDPKPDRLELADLLVGVPANTAPTYDVSLLSHTTDEITTMFADAAQAELGIVPQ